MACLTDGHCPDCDDMEGCRAERWCFIASEQWQTPKDKALAFYADPANWKSPSTGFALQYDREPSPVEKDRGARAREVIGGTP